MNADVLSRSGVDIHGQNMPFGSIATATAISAAFGSLLVGLTGNLPVSRCVNVDACSVA